MVQMQLPAQEVLKLLLARSREDVLTVYSLGLSASVKDKIEVKAVLQCRLAHCFGVL